MNSTASCPKCKTANTTTALNCDACGARLPWAEDAKAAAAPKDTDSLDEFFPTSTQQAAAPIALVTTPVTVNATPIRFCFNCGGALNPLANFCAFCGAPIAAASGNVAPLATPRQQQSSVQGEVNNTYVWVLAFAPFWAWAVIGAASGAAGLPLMKMAWGVPLINWGVCLLDLAYLESQGKKLNLGLASFLVPAYLFVRAERLGHTPNYAWVWLVMFLFSLLPFGTVILLRR